jgi:hypothetical protein
MEWVPGVRVGPFEFGAKPDPIPESWQKRPAAPDEGIQGIRDPRDFGWYSVDELQIKVLLEDGRVEWIHCEVSLNYQGVEIIGMRWEELHERIRPELDEGEGIDFDPGFGIIRSSHLGGEFIVVNGRVSGVICKPIVPPEE